MGEQYLLPPPRDQMPDGDDAKCFLKDWQDMVPLEAGIYAACVVSVEV